MRKIIVIAAAVFAVAACGRKNTPAPVTPAVKNVSVVPVTPSAEVQALIGNWVKTKTEKDLVTLDVIINAKGEMIVWKTRYEFDGKLFSPLEYISENYTYKLLDGKKIELTRLENGEPTKDVRTLTYSISNNELTMLGFNFKKGASK